MTAAARLVDAWYRPRLTALTAPLLPLSWLFGAAASLRRALYARGVLARHRVARPVVVIGNLTVGGGGKTPATIALARALSARGARPGIVSGGYGGRARAPRMVKAGDVAADVGDEALVLADAGFPVAVGRDRPAAANALLAAHPACTVLLCDDGLQHYALARDVEIVVIDGSRGFGNGRLLPAGPLREPESRLESVDAIVRLGPVVQSSSTAPPAGDGRETAVVHRPLSFRRVVDDVAIPDAAGAWRARAVEAIAGIANPQRFFDLLRAQGVDAAAHPFPDHHAFVAADIAQSRADIIVMTQKDAVKCRSFADTRCYYLPIEAELDPALVDRVLGLIERT